MHVPLDKVAHGLQGGCPGIEEAQSECEGCGGMPAPGDVSAHPGWTPRGNSGEHGACLAAGAQLPACCQL